MGPGARAEVREVRLVAVSTFDHMAEAYDAAVSIERKHDFFLEHLPERRKRALDVGCGTGGLARRLADHFESVLAIDVSEPMLAIARAKRPAPNLEYRLADANTFVPEGEFDAIVSHTTFHHVANVPGVVQRLRLSGVTLLLPPTNEKSLVRHRRWIQLQRIPDGFHILLQSHVRRLQ